MATQYITCKDAVIMLTAPTIFSSAFQLEGFKEDQAVSITTGALQATQLGVDGHMAIGAISSKSTITIDLIADSPSWEYLNPIYNKMKNKAFTGMASTIVMTFPAHGIKATCARCAILDIQLSFSEARKVFMGGRIVIDAQDLYIEDI